MNFSSFEGLRCTFLKLYDSVRKSEQKASLGLWYYKPICINAFAIDTVKLLSYFKFGYVVWHMKHVLSK